MAKTLSKNGKTATITLRPSGEFHYNVWHPSKGFIASGFRKTEADAIKAAETVLKAK